MECSELGMGTPIVEKPCKGSIALSKKSSPTLRNFRNQASFSQSQKETERPRPRWLRAPVGAAGLGARHPCPRLRLLGAAAARGWRRLPGGIVPSPGLSADPAAASLHRFRGRSRWSGLASSLCTRADDLARALGSRNAARGPSESHHSPYKHIQHAVRPAAHRLCLTSRRRWHRRGDGRAAVQEAGEAPLQDAR